MGGFWISTANVSTGQRVVGSQIQLRPHPTEVDYPVDPKGALMTTRGGGNVLRQMTERDGRIHTWVWKGLPTAVPRYERLAQQLESLSSKMRREQGLSPFLYFKDDETDTLGAWANIAGSISSTTATTLTDTSKSFAGTVNGVIEITSGPGTGQRRSITAATGSQLTITPAWNIQPTGTYTVQAFQNLWAKVRVLNVTRQVQGHGSVLEDIRVDFVIDGYLNETPQTHSLTTGLQGSLAEGFADPGTQIDFPLAFGDSFAAGAYQSKFRWDWTSNLDIPGGFGDAEYSTVMHTGSGPDGTNCVEFITVNGYDDMYWQYTDERVGSDYMTFHGYTGLFDQQQDNHLHVTVWFNLNGANAGTYDVPLINCYNTTCAVALTPSGHLKLFRDSGNGTQVLLGTSTVTVPATGWFCLEFRGEPSTDKTTANGWLWLRLNNTLVPFTPAAGGSPVRIFENIILAHSTLPDKPRLMNSVGFGPGTGWDYGYYPNLDGTQPDFDITGGLPGVLMSAPCVWDPVVGSGQYDYVGMVKMRAGAAAQSELSDDTPTTYVAFPSNTSHTYSIASISSSNVNSVVSIAPYYYGLTVRTSGSGSSYLYTRGHWTVTSGGSTAADGNRIPANAASFSSLWGAFNQAWMPSLFQYSANGTSWENISYNRWGISTDPHTNAPWTMSAINALTMTISVGTAGYYSSGFFDPNPSNIYEMRLSDLGVEVCYR
jgi:hypothetical protein